MSNKPSEKDLRQYTLFKVWQPLQNVEERDQKLVRDIVFGPQQRRDPTQSIATIKVLKDDEQRRIHSLCLDGYNLHTPSMSKIGKLDQLNTLSFRAVYLPRLPSSIGRLQNLVSLRISARGLHSLPDEIGDLENLRQLYISGTSIDTLPTSIGKLQNLREIRICQNHDFESLPNEIGNLKNLSILNLSGTSIQTIPETIGDLANLKILHLNNNQELHSLPDSIWKLQNLIDLVLCQTGIAELEHPDTKEDFELNVIRKLPKLLYMECGWGIAKPQLLLRCRRIIPQLHSSNESPNSDNTILHELWPNMLGKAHNLFNTSYKIDTMEREQRLMHLYYNKYDYFDNEPAINQVLWKLEEYRANSHQKGMNYNSSTYLPQYHFAPSRCLMYSMPSKSIQWLSQSEAIHQLLLQKRESFIELLVNRNK